MSALNTTEAIRVAVRKLAARSEPLARAHRSAGTPPLRAREPGFASLLRIIFAQQLSTHAAAAITARIDAAVGELTPRRFAAADDEVLRAAGLSRSKIAYGKGLAADVQVGRTDLAAIAGMEDEAAITALTRTKGIGRWTAEIYLLFALGRPDLWPVDDLAVREAVRRLNGLARRPNRGEMVAIGEPWRPWRSAAARLLWHFYNATPVG